MTEHIYNKIGTNYNSTRRADPYITGRLHALLSPIPGGQYLDIGCGTGNYTTALANTGLHMTGVEPSDIMIQKARAAHPDISFVQGTAEAIPFDDNTFHGGIGTFTIHHWKDIRTGLREIHRVLQPGGRLVLLSFAPEQLMGYWLCHYFPVTMKNSAEVVVSTDEMITIFRDCGFTSVETEKYFVHEGLTDHFLYSNKYHPAAYLDPAIRANVSSFSVYAHKEEIQPGLQRLEDDIRSGEINEIIHSYENSLGDYLFYCAMKA